MARKNPRVSYTTSKTTAVPTHTSFFFFLGNTCGCIIWLISGMRRLERKQSIRSRLRKLLSTNIMIFINTKCWRSLQRGDDIGTSNIKHELTFNFENRHWNVYISSRRPDNALIAQNSKSFWKIWHMDKLRFEFVNNRRMYNFFYLV